MLHSLRKACALLLRPALVFLVMAGLTSTVLIIINKDDDEGHLTAAEHDHSTALYFPSPSTVQELVNVSEAIVVAQIIEMEEQTIEGPWNYCVNTDTREGVPPPPKYPYSYYRLNILETLLDDGSISKYPTLRLKGHATDSITDRRIGLPQKGESFVLFLRSDPGNRSYGVVGPWAMIYIGDSTVKEYGSTLKEPQFAQSASPSRFKADVAAAIPDRIPMNPAGLKPQSTIILSDSAQDR